MFIFYDESFHGWKEEVEEEVEVEEEEEYDDWW